MVASDNLY